MSPLCGSAQVSPVDSDLLSSLGNGLEGLWFPRLRRGITVHIRLTWITEGIYCSFKGLSKRVLASARCALDHTALQGSKLDMICPFFKIDAAGLAKTFCRDKEIRVRDGWSEMDVARDAHRKALLELRRRLLFFTSSSTSTSFRSPPCHRTILCFTRLKKEPRAGLR